MQAAAIRKPLGKLARVLKTSPPWARASLFSSTERVNSYYHPLEEENAACESTAYSLSLRRHFHSAAPFFSGNSQKEFTRSEFNHQKNIMRVPSSSMVMPTRLISSEAKVGENDSAAAETVKGLHDKMLNCAVEKRTAPPNSWLWSLIAKCSTDEDIKLLFDILQKLRTLRLSNLRIPDDFNNALCREVTKACVRAGAIDFGMKTLWKHNLIGLTPDIGSAHHLLLHAKQHNDVTLMVKLMILVKKNDLPLQPGTADIVFSICYSTDRWDLMCKYGKRFVKSGVKLRQAPFELWMEFAAKKGDVESLWKIEKWRSEAMKQHSVSTGFSCTKGFLLEHKPESAAAIIQVLYQTLPGTKRSSILVELQKLAGEWPLDVIRYQEDDNKKAFAAALQSDISTLINILPSFGVEANVSVKDFYGSEMVSS